MERRRFAAGLAALGGIGLAGLAGLAAWSASRMDPVLAPHATRYAVELLALAAVVAVGLVLLARRKELGVALLVAAAALTPPALLTLGGVLSAVGAGPVGIVVAVPHLAVAAAGSVAWTARRAERWRWTAPCSWPYVVVATALVLATCFVWIRDPLLPGLPADGGAGFAPGGAGLVATTAVALLLLAAARLPRRLAAGMLVGAVVHVLPSALLGIQHAARQGWTITPAGWVALTSAVSLGVVAVWWRDADRRVEAGRQQALADAAGLPDVS